MLEQQSDLRIADNFLNSIKGFEGDVTAIQRKAKGDVELGDILEICSRS